MAKRAKNNTKGKTKKATAKKVAPKSKPSKARAKAAKPKAKIKAKAKPAKSAASAPKRRFQTVKFTLPQPIMLDLPPALHDRLKQLSLIMSLPMEGVIRQALMEFAETWEDHHRTVASLADSSDRMMVVDKE